MKHWKNNFRYLKFLPIILLGLTPVLWFWGRGDILINGIDTNFPLDPKLWLSKRFYVWNDDLNAGVDFSSSIAGILFHLVQVIPQVLGSSLQGSELLSLLFWFSTIVGTSLFFAYTIFGKRLIPVAVFVILYSLNIYLFNTWENVKVANLSLVASLPLGLALLQRLRDGRLSYFSGFPLIALCGLLLSGSGINPAYFLCFLIISFLFYLGSLGVRGDRYEIKKRTLEFSFFLGILILVNLFWILPTVDFISQNFRSDKSIDVAGYTNWLDSLSKNTSILNIMRVQGAWDWYAYDSTTGLPYYIPYSLNYFHRIPFLFFSFFLSALVIISLIFREVRYRHLYFSFALMFILGVFLGVGTHLPTGDIYRILVNIVPFFSLFRSPWYIFTPLVTLAIAGLVSLLLIKLERINYKGLKLKYAVWSFGLILIIGNLLYSYPLLTGKIFRPGRDDTFFISFPSYVFEAKQWLDENKDDRILTYPDDEIEKFTWKYRGVESILQLLSNKEVLFLPLNSPDAPTPKIVKELYLLIKKRELTAAEALAAKLSTSLLFEKADQPSLSFQLPAKMKENLLVKFGDWLFYKFPSGNSNEKIFISNSTHTTSQDSNAYPKIMSTLENKTLLTNENDSVLKTLLDVSNLSGFAGKATNIQEKNALSFLGSESFLSNRLKQRDLTQVTYEIDIPNKGYYKPVLEIYKLEDFGISPQENLSLKHNKQETIWTVEKVDDSFVYYKPFFLENGVNTFSLNIQSKNLVGVNQFLGDFYKEGQGEFKVLGKETDIYLEILNKDTKDTSAVFPISTFDPLQMYLIQLKYKQIYGNNASVIVGQNTQNTLIKVNVERLPNYPEWNYFSFYYQPVATNSVMKVGLIAPQTSDPLGTKISYGDLQVYKVFSNSLIFLEEKHKSENTGKATFTKVSPVFYKGKVENAAKSHFLIMSENYSPEWQLTLIDSTGKAITMDKEHLSANLFANAWYITNSTGTYNFEIYYKPQRLFVIGFLISLSSIIVSIIIFLYNKTRRKNEKKIR